MRKLHSLTLLCVLFAFDLSAQCRIPNADFEKWMDFSDTLGYEMDLVLSESIEFPEAWFPLERTVNIVLSDFFTPYLFEDTLDVPVFQTYQKMSPGLRSDHALMLYGDDAFELSDAFTTFSCSESPSELSFLAQYVGNETGLLQIYVLVGPERLDFNTAYGYGQVYVESSDVLAEKKISCPITYRSDERPSKAVIQLKRLAMDNMSEDVEGYFVVDDLSFDDESQEEVPLTPTANPVKLFPNPASAQATDYISVDFTYNKVQLYGINGAYFGAQDFNAKGISISALPAGTYVAKFTNGLIAFSELLFIHE